jgi:hypothetical protein
MRSSRDSISSVMSSVYSVSIGSMRGRSALLGALGLLAACSLNAADGKESSKDGAGAPASPEAESSAPAPDPQATKPEAAKPEAAKPEAAKPDASSPGSAPDADAGVPSDPRGSVLRVLSPGPSDPQVAQIGIQGDKVFVTRYTETGSDASTSVASRSLDTCEVANCGATIRAVVLPGALDQPVHIDQDRDALLVRGVTGDSARIAPGAVIQTYGSDLKLAGDYNGKVGILGDVVAIGSRRRAHHGNYNELSLYRLGVTPNLVKRYEAGEVNGYRVFTTQTRMFFPKRSGFYAGGVLAVDPASGATSVYFNANVVSAWAFGERVFGLDRTDRDAAVPTYRFFVCESDTSCASPAFFPDFAYTRTRHLIGTVGDEFLFFGVDDAAKATTGDLMSCSKSALLSGTCTPTAVATGLPLPRKWGMLTTGYFVSNGSSVLYVDEAGAIVRVKL